jgi:hypothetical protein
VLVFTIEQRHDAWHAIVGLESNRRIGSLRLESEGTIFMMCRMVVAA